MSYRAVITETLQSELGQRFDRPSFVVDSHLLWEGDSYPNAEEVAGFAQEIALIRATEATTGGELSHEVKIQERRRILGGRLPWFPRTIEVLPVPVPELTRHEIA